MTWDYTHLPDAERIARNVPLSQRTWFRTGGMADALYTARDLKTLAAILAALPIATPLTILGACSNVIIRDGGIEGLVIRLAGAFAEISSDATGITVGAAARDSTVAEAAAQADLTGAEFLCGIPGSIGGAIVMNAGAYGSEMANIIDWIELLHRDGSIERLNRSRLTFCYRSTRLPPGSLVVRTRLELKPGTSEEIRSKMREIRESREKTQPVHSRTGGSTFRNPPGQKAWLLIDQASCRGLQIGGAQMSDLHCNFMLNLGHASSDDLETLGTTVQARVKEKFGISLEWEIKRLGRRL